MGRPPPRRRCTALRFRIVALLLFSICGFYLLLDHTLDIQRNLHRWVYHPKAKTLPNHSPEDAKRSRLGLANSLLVTNKSTTYRRLVLAAHEHANCTCRTLDLLPNDVLHVASIDDPLRPPTPAQVPFAPAATDPGITYAFASTLERIRDSLDSIAYSAAGPKTELYITVPASDEPQISSTVKLLQAAGFQAEIHTSQLESWDERWLETVLRLASLASTRKSTPWYAMLDDDTFFPSPGDIWAMLARYDSPLTKPWYVGSNAESEWISFHWPAHANGGAGIFLSAALLEKVAAQTPEKSCVESERRDTAADEYLGVCLDRKFGIKQSEEGGLHQFHFNGNPDGMYESPGSMLLNASDKSYNPRLLSVHHWKRQFPRDVLAMSSVRRKTGDRGIFHRYMFWDNSGLWIMTNGYSLVHHSMARYHRHTGSAAFKTLTNTTEMTWDAANPKDYESRMGVTRRPDKAKTKQRYDFRAAFSGQGEEPWSGFFVHEDIYTVDVVEVIWV